MIGLIFFAAICLWLLFTAYLTVQVPRWLGLPSPANWLVRLLLVPLLLVGPLADHIIGIRQFQRLCVEEGRLQLSPAAANTNRAIGTSGDSELLEGYAIPIERQVRRIIDLDTGEQIAQYKFFQHARWCRRKVARDGLKTYLLGEAAWTCRCECV